MADRITCHDAVPDLIALVCDGKPAPVVLERHLKECTSCKSRSGHLKAILTTLESADWANPSENDPEAFIDSKTGRIQWKKAPWYLRFGVEGLALTLVSVLIAVLLPRVRLIYENRLEKQLRAADFAELPMAQPELEGKSDESAAGVAPLAEDESADEDGDRGAAAEDQDSPKDVKVGPAEIWRMTIRTDSPKELRTRVAEILKESKIGDASGAEGVSAPGGIQFDLMVPKDRILPIKERLEDLAKSIQSSQTLIRDSFTWFKSKARTRIPEGQARLVIWISQI